MKYIPKEKLSLGIPFYYWKWDDARQKIVDIGGFDAIARSMYLYKNPIIGFDEVEQTPFLKYARDGKNYTIWFENATSIATRLELIRTYDLHGFSAWALGLEPSAIHSEFKR